MPASNYISLSFQIHPDMQFDYEFAHRQIKYAEMTKIHCHVTKLFTLPLLYENMSILTHEFSS
jgi:hypothetical protein